MHTRGLMPNLIKKSWTDSTAEHNPYPARRGAAVAPGVLYFTYALTKCRRIINVCSFFQAKIYGNREEIVCQGCLKDDILSCGTIKCEKLRKVGAREKKEITHEGIW